MDDSLSGDEEAHEGCNLLAETEDVLIVDPVQNQIVCIYDGTKRRQNVTPPKKCGVKLLTDAIEEPLVVCETVMNSRRNGGGSEVNLVALDCFNNAAEVKATLPVNSPSPKSSEDGSSALC